MMNDEFLRSLKGEWQSQHADAAASIARLRARRWVPHVQLTAELLLTLAGVLAGVWFALRAMSAPDNRLLFALSAAAMLGIVPIVCLIGLRLRRRGLHWDDQTPEALLETGLRRAEVSLRLLQLGRWNIVILAAFVAILWITQWLGWIEAHDFLVLYTCLCLTLSAFTWAWIIWSRKRLQREHASYARLLEMMRSH